MALTKSSNQVIQTPYKRNVIINGNVPIWQRGSSATNITTGGTLILADRFKVTNTTDGTLTYTKGTNNAPNNIGQYIWLTPNVADASLSAAQTAILQYVVEGYDIRSLIGKTCTLSFWAYGSVAGTYCVSIQNCGTLPPDRTYLVEYTLSAGASFEYKTITFPMHDLLSGSNWNTTNGGGLRITWCIGAGSGYIGATTNTWMNTTGYSTSNQVNIMANTSYGFGLTGVQLEVGSVATPFEFRPFAEELALCQRYYEKSFEYATAPAQNTNQYGGCYVMTTVQAGAAAQYGQVLPYRVRKRIVVTTPTLYNPVAANAQARNSSHGDCTSTSAQFVSESGFGVYCIPHATNTAGSYCAVHWTADAEL